MWDSRFGDAIDMIKDRLSPQEQEFLSKVMDVYYECDNGYRDYNDWEDYCYDKGEDGLEAYLCALFGLEYTPVEEEEEED